MAIRCSSTCRQRSICSRRFLTFRRVSSRSPTIRSARPHMSSLNSFEPSGIARAAQPHRRPVRPRRGAAPRPEQVLITNGAQQSITLALALLVGPDDVVLTEHTTWPGLADTVRRLGGRLHGIRMDDARHRRRGSRGGHRRLRPALIAVNPHHHNPTGTRLSARTAAHARRHRRRLRDTRSSRIGSPPPLAFDGVVAPPMASLRPDANVFVIDSLSKTAWAGLRIGWVRADQQAIHELRSLKALSDLMPPMPSQLLALPVLDELDEIIADRVVSCATAPRCSSISSTIGCPTGSSRQFAVACRCGHACPTGQPLRSPASPPGSASPWPVVASSPRHRRSTTTSGFRSPRPRSASRRRQASRPGVGGVHDGADRRRRGATRRGVRTMMDAGMKYVDQPTVRSRQRSRLPPRQCGGSSADIKVPARFSSEFQGATWLHPADCVRCGRQLPRSQQAPGHRRMGDDIDDRRV